MLKILKSENSPTRPDDLEPSWAMVRTNQKSHWTTLKLPLTIGHHVDNDIFVNAPTMRHVSKILVNAHGVLTLVDAQTQNKSDLGGLSLFGLEVLGPFTKNPDTLSSLGRQAELALRKEQAAYLQRYPKLLRNILPAAQKLRLLTIAASALVCVGFIQLADSDSNRAADLSAKARAAAIGNVTELRIHSAGAGSSYAKGATISFGGASENEALPYALTMSLAGLDITNELSIHLNGTLIGQTAASLSCIDAYCQREFGIDRALLRKDHNVLQIVHNNPESSYTLKNVFLRAMEPASDEDRELATQLLTSADRYYEERLLLVQNIRTAMDAIEKVETILSTRTGLDSLKPHFSISKRKINDAFQELSKDLLFKLEKELKLGHDKPALALIQDLMKLYPDPSSRQYLMLAAQKKKLTEAKK